MLSAQMTHIHARLCLCLLQTTTPRLSSSCDDVSPTVRVKIIFLKNAVQHHHWCFPFAVDGNPEPTISWLYNGQELKNSKFTYTKFIPDSGDGSVKHGCLNLNKPTHINNGNYTLIVQNKLGRDEATAFGLFMENPFGTLDPEGKILGELLRLNIFISRKIRMVEQVSWLWPADAYHYVCFFIFISTC